MVIFQRTSHTLHIIRVGRCSVFRVNFQKFLKKHFRSFHFRLFVACLTETIVTVCFCKSIVVEQCIDIKAGAPYHNGDFSFCPDFFHISLGFLLEDHDIIFLIGIKFINEIMGYAVCFFFRHFRCANIHITINLHGIGRNDLTTDFLCQQNGHGGFAAGRRPANDNKRFFHGHPSILYAFEFLFQFIAGQLNDGRTSMGAGKGIFQLQQLRNERFCLLDAQTVMTFHRRFACHGCHR